MTDRRFLLVFGIILLAASVITYIVHLWLFQDLHHILIFLVGDIAFVPIEVLLVSLVIHGLLERRAIAERRDKMGMLIGAFFSTVGIDLLAILSRADPDLDRVRLGLRRETDWSPDDQGALRDLLVRGVRRVDPSLLDLEALQCLLAERQDFLLRMIENPALLEHESFSELMRAVFHLAEELDRRPVLDAVPDPDRAHLGVDADRVYPMLTSEWLDYLQYIGRHYPYLYSLALRTSPFDPGATVIVQGSG